MCLATDDYIRYPRASLVTQYWRATGVGCVRATWFCWKAARGGAPRISVESCSAAGSWNIVLRDCGTVFELTPTTTGKWDRRILHSFNGKDGANPFSALIFDSTGNLYGTTSQGGNLSGCGGVGCGVVFKLAPDANGMWTETVLHVFNEKNGAIPYASLVFDSAGNLYGTTVFGGNIESSQCGKNIPGCGVVFELSPGTDGKWTTRVLHAFNPTYNANDGAYPYASLILDSVGNLYGTTLLSGTGSGTVFRLTPAKDGGWNEKVLHNFDGTDGAYPYASLLFDTAGTLYGTTEIGGAFRMGTVFELIPRANDRWEHVTLHNFSGNGDGASPNGLIFDRAGNLYGTTSDDGIKNTGTVFRLTPQNSGKWSETVLFKFNGKDGAHPQASLILDAAGNLFGTTVNGGASGFGSVFELTP
jgi:uncharacterized repeat protein (TIGR03803 family)